MYGSTTLAQVDERLGSLAQAAKVRLQTFQSNHEGSLIDRIHDARDTETAEVAFIIINPAAFTHTSAAIRDALAAVAVPFVEVHLSNVHRREAFRHHSFFSDLAEAVIAGLGPYGYEAALNYALARIGNK